MNQREALDAVLAELHRARGLHPTWPDDRIHAAAIVAEEAGELVRAALDEHYAPSKCPMGSAQTEAIHTAATAIRFMVGG